MENAKTNCVNRLDGNARCSKIRLVRRGILFSQIEGIDMRRITGMFSLYVHGCDIDRLRGLTSATLISNCVPDLRAGLDSLVSFSAMYADAPSFKSSHAAAKRLKDTIDKVLKLELTDTLGLIAEPLASALAGFESLLNNDLEGLHLYQVMSVAGYDTEVLLENAHQCLPEKVFDGMDEIARKCFREGAKCFAFQLATSAGFQLLRSVEAVMRQYYDVLSNGAPRPARESMGNFTDAMEKIPTIDPRMLGVLKDIKNLRRNPL